MKSREEHISWQKRIKEEHKNRILTLLKENGAMRFKDFLAQSEKTGIRSEKGLSEVLKRLQDEGLIEKTHIEVEVPKGEVRRGLRGEALERPTAKKQIEAYKLTTEGQKYQSWWLIYELLELEEKNAGYLHSLSNDYGNFGLSYDVIITGKDGQLASMIPPIPQIEDFIMKKTFEKIKAKNLKLERSDGKFLMSFEIDFEKFSNELIAIQTFIDDIKNGKDVFADERLPLSTSQNRLWALDYLINYSLFFGDHEFRPALVRYLQKLSEKATFTATFGNVVDFEFVKQFVDTIIEGKDPLDSKRMLKKLLIKGRGTGVELPLFAYIKVAKLINFNKEDVYFKICYYEEQKLNELYNPNSKLQLLINEVRGDAKRTHY